MALALNKLSDAVARNVTKAGRISDGGGLYLEITPSNTKSWAFMWKLNGKRRQMGLGPYPLVTLAEARRRAAEARSLVEAGRDPITERLSGRAEAVAPQHTFRQAVAAFLDEDRLSGWKNEKHRAQWSMTLGKAYCKAILDRPVADIGLADVLSILKPVWTAKPETASRLRG